MAAYTPVKCKCGDPTLAVIPPNPFTGASSAPVPATHPQEEVATTEGSDVSESKETTESKEVATTEIKSLEVAAGGSDPSEAKDLAAPS